MDGIFDLAAALPAFSSDQAAVMRRLFGPDDAALAAHSTLSYARREHPRLLVLDTTDDAAVCREAFHAFRTRMSALGSPAEFVELPGLGHNEGAVDIGMDDDPVMPTLLAFIRAPRPAAR